MNILKRKSVIRCGFLLCQISLCVLGDAARANFALKPSGQNAIPLRRKALDVAVELRGGVASAVQTMTFANETNVRTEADFILTIPPGAVVSGFAYWYGSEKVVARVVEKERAALIYRHITSRMRDPALIEMIGKNTFRARIFPVMPNADLKVEIRTVQPLSSTRNGLLWRLPLKPEQAGTGTLDELNVRVKIADNDANKKIFNDFKGTSQLENSAQILSFSRRNYRPDRDLNVSLLQTPRALSSSVFAARSGGNDGFFAVRLSARETLRNPRVRVLGSVYDVVSAPPKVWRAGENWIVCGRYKGSGSAQLIIAGQNAQGREQRWNLPIALNATREDNNAATKLWAWARMTQLSTSAKNRAQIVALSTRFTLPSKYTSWLAIPREERERYAAEKAQADMEIVSNLLVRQIAAGNGSSREAQKLRTRFEALRKQASYSNPFLVNLQAALQQRYQTRLELQSSKTGNQRKLRQVQREIAFLRAEATRRGGNDEDYQRNLAYYEGQFLAHEIAHEIEENGENARVNRLRARFKALSNNQGENPNYFERQAVNNRLANVAAQLVAQKYAVRKNPVRLKELHAQVKRLASASKQEVGKVLLSAERERAGTRVRQISYRLANEVAAGREREKDYRVLDKELDILASRTQWGKSSLMMNGLRDSLSNWTQQAAAEKYKRDSDAIKVAELNLRVARLQKALGLQPNQLAGSGQWELTRALQAEREQYLVEMKKPKTEARQLKAIENHITRLYTDPDYKAPIESYYENPDNGQRELPKDKPPFEQPKFQAIREVYERARQADNDADMTPLNARERQRLATEKKAAFEKLQYATRYFLRLGDPLISLDAPQDAQSVVAVMPDGSVKRLLWNATNRKWEARFDIPSYATPGEYSISLLVVLQNGVRSKTTLRYLVDMTAPQGVARAQITNSLTDNSLPDSATQTVIRLDLETDEQTARVVALLPWGERLELKPSAQNKNRFFALATPPASWSQNSVSAVTYIVTDKAHNRTTIAVDLKK